ncbi:uncharacterized protein LOC143782239 [Ranitomeya variabilis]|uniref:uncharacterized protein LOC143782239 n=1 Tax=Ranitomeya variabilis TaxID=490064 RepID=UPI0040578292
MFLQLEGVKSGRICLKSLSSADSRSKCKNLLGQFHHSGICEPSGWYKVRKSNDHSCRHLPAGRDSSNIPNSPAHQRCREHQGRLPQPKRVTSRGMDLKQIHIQYDNRIMGDTTNRPICHKRQPASKKVRFPERHGSPRYVGLSPPSLEVPAGIRLSSDVSDSTSDQKNQEGTSKSDPHCTILAEKTMVLLSPDHVPMRSMDSPIRQETAVPRPLFPPASERSSLDGVEFERQLLRSRGFSAELVNTLLLSRKRSTTLIYSRVWNKFLDFYMVPFTKQVPVTPILEFLQKGRELGLSVNTLRVQVSALGALYGCNIAANRWISRFIKSCERSKPVHIPRLPPWDLNLVLEALTSSPFEPLDSIPLKVLTYKVALLVALTSARRVSDIQALSVDPPYLLIFHDRIVLKPDPSYLPKVASTYHRSQEIFLPSFFDSPVTPEQHKFHTLDVRRAILTYIERCQTWRGSRALFISFQGHKKGHGVTRATISRWIRDAICLAYTSKGEIPPVGIKAHSTRAMASSWAEQADVPIHLI